MTQVFFREGRRLFFRLFGVLGTRAVIAACLLLAAGVSIPALQSLWFIVRGTAADATVVRQDEELAADWDRGTSSGKAGPRMAPAQRVFQAVLQFKVGDRLYEVFAAKRGPVHVYPLGSKQVVVFPAGQPQLARLRAELPDFWTQAGLVLMGTFVAAGTVRWWWAMSRRRLRFRRRAGFARDRAARHAPAHLRIDLSGEPSPPGPAPEAEAPPRAVGEDSPQSP